MPKRRGRRDSILPPLHGGYRADPNATPRPQVTPPKPPKGKGGGSASTRR